MGAPYDDLMLADPSQPQGPTDGSGLTPDQRAALAAAVAGAPAPMDTTLRSLLSPPYPDPPPAGLSPEDHANITALLGGPRPAQSMSDALQSLPGPIPAPGGADPASLDPTNGLTNGMGLLPQRQAALDDLFGRAPSLAPTASDDAVQGFYASLYPDPPPIGLSPEDHVNITALLGGPRPAQSVGYALQSLPGQISAPGGADPASLDPMNGLSNGMGLLPQHQIALDALLGRWPQLDQTPAQPAGFGGQPSALAAASAATDLSAAVESGARPAAAAQPSGPVGAHPSVSVAAQAFIRKLELQAKTQQPYFNVTNDVAGNPTFGYGHKVAPADVAALKRQLAGLNPDQRKALMERYYAQDLQAAQDRVVDQLGADTVSGLTQNQYDALVADSFNAGEGGALGPQMRPKIWDGDMAAAGKQFNAWWGTAKDAHNHPYKKMFPGLVSRSLREAAMFNNGDYNYQPSEAEVAAIMRRGASGPSPAGT